MIERYGLIVVFLNVLLEQAGLPLPSYPVLMIATTLAVGATGVAGFAAGEMSALPAIFLAGIAGALIADLAWFFAARRYGRRVLITLCRFRYRRIPVFGRPSRPTKFGPLSLTFAKFVPGLTNVAVALAGLTKTPPAVFIICDLIGAVLFVGAAIVLGLFFRGAIADVLFVLDALGRLGLVVLAATLGLYLAAKWWQRQRFVRQLRMDRITVDELRILIADGAKPVILDVRSNELRAREGFIPARSGQHVGARSSIARISARHRSRGLLLLSERGIGGDCDAPSEACRFHQDPSAARRDRGLVNRRATRDVGDRGRFSGGVDFVPSRRRLAPAIVTAHFPETASGHACCPNEISIRTAGATNRRNMIC